MLIFSILKSKSEPIFKSNIVKNYLSVLEVISSLNCELEYKSGVGRIQKMSDLEVVTLSFTAEFMSIDSKNSLLKLVDVSHIPNLIERNQFHKRRRKLFLFSDEIRLKLASRFWEFEDYFIVDCMPLEICKCAHHQRIKICKKDFVTALSKGCCASQNS